MDLDAEKALVAEHAAGEVKDGMLVGLGTGSTAAYLVRALGRRAADGLRIRATATSTATEELARSLGIPTVPFEGIERVDLTIDGADEVDGRLNAIKGAGGALLREKVVASASDRMIVIVDSSKPVEKLGRARLPVEVLPFAAAWVESRLSRLGAAVERRRRTDGAPFRTDQGNYVFDCAFGLLDDPAALAAELDRIPGLMEHGLFVTEIDTVLVARGERVETRTREVER